MTIAKTLNKGLTVADLINDLSQMPQDAVVCFVCDYGDYWHTEQLLPVGEVVKLEDNQVVSESGYSQSGIAIQEKDEDDDSDRPNVVILR